MLPLSVLLQSSDPSDPACFVIAGQPEGGADGITKKNAAAEIFFASSPENAPKQILSSLNSWINKCRASAQPQILPWPGSRKGMLLLGWNCPPEGIFAMVVAAPLPNQYLNEMEKHRQDLVADVIHLAFLDWDIPSGAMFFSPQWARMLGYEPERIPARIEIWSDFVHPEDLPDSQTKLNAHLENRSPAYRTELRLRCQDGSYRWVYAHGLVINRAADGRPLRMIGINLDIHERKTTELALRQATSRLAMLLDHSLLGTWEWNPGEKNIIFGEEVYRHLAYAQAKIPLPGALLHTEDAALLEKAFLSQTPTSDCFEHEIRLCSAQNSWRWFSLRGCAPKTAARPGQMIGTLLDITDLKTTQENLSRFQEELKQSNQKLSIALTETKRLAYEAALAGQAKSQMLTDLSHEIRSPLNSISGFCELLKEDHLTDYQRHSVETIERSLDLLLNYLNDILEAARADAGHLTFAKEPVNLETLCHECLNIAQSRMDTRPVDLLYRGPEQLPSVVTDPLRLKQVILNLLTNAIKFTHTRHVCLSCEVIDEDDAEAAVRIRVEDTGIGIPSGDLASIFEPYIQLRDPSGPVLPGSGLGLSIAQKMAQGLDSSIQVESAPGKGSIFYFVLRGCSSAPENFLTQDAENFFDLRGLSVLAIENNPLSCEILTETFGRFGIQCCIASDPTSAGERLRQQWFDILLAGLHFPAQQLRELQAIAGQIYGKNQPYFIGLARHPREVAYDLIHWDATMVKPLNTTKIAGTLRRLLSEPGPGSIYASAGSEPGVENNTARTLLLVEDSETDRQIVKKLLEKWGHTVLESANADQAWNLLQRAKVDLVLIDLELPGQMNGFELAEKIRGHYPALPIAALTGHAEREFQEKALAFRLNGYLTKPIKREHFQNLFETVFGNRFCFEERTNWRVLLIHEKSEERQSLLQAFSARFPRVKLQSAENGVPGLVMLGGFAPDLLLLSSGLTDMDPAVVLKFLSGNSRYRNLACLVLTPTEQFLPEYQRFLELNAAAVLPHSAHHHRVLSAASKYYAAAARSAGAMPGSAPYSLTGSLSRELGMSAEDYHEIANHFFANAQESIRQLATLGLTNHAESARITHALKGNALSLRLFAAVSIIKQVDAALALKKEDMLKKALDNLNSMIMCLDKALSNPKN